MSDELFSPDTGKQDSPRLAWLKQHSLCVWHTKLEGDEEDEFGNRLGPWTCCRADRPDDVLFGRAGVGDTEGEACAAYATRHGIPLWNEASA